MPSKKNIAAEQVSSIMGVEPVTAKAEPGDLYSALRQRHQPYDAEYIAGLLEQINEVRISGLAEALSVYIEKNLGNAIKKRNGLEDYRTNPYVLLTSANVLKLSDPSEFAAFLFNNKIYAGLETSFGKLIEAAFVSQYPIGASIEHRWGEPREKIAESTALKKAKLTKQQKAQARSKSVWREIDKACVVGDRRYLISIKSGPNCINDTQVAGMVSAISSYYQDWMDQTQQNYPDVSGIDVVVGITYGTELTTNNKENQILAKLLDLGFQEEDRRNRSGVLIDETGRVRVYRCIGQDFWSFIGNPTQLSSASFVFLEVLLALSKALSQGMKQSSLEERVNTKLTQLAHAMLNMRFPRAHLPQWIRDDFREDDLFWLATALSAFFDQGI